MLIQIQEWLNSCSLIGLTNINSMGYDAVNKLVYYTFSFIRQWWFNQSQ
jgi:hypothetical protein